MSLAGKIKTLNDKFKASKAQYSLDKEAVKLFPLSSGKL